MKVLILAGGFARRMWPLTLEIPKPLLEVNGKPMIEHILDKLADLPGISQVYLTTNKKFDQMFREWHNGCEKAGSCKIIMEEHESEEEKFGSIGAIRHFLEKTGMNEDLLVIGGDNLFEGSLKDLLQLCNEKKTPVVAFYDLGNPEIVRKRFGVGVLDNDNRLVDFQEKPENPKSALTSTCIYLFPREVLPLFDKYFSEGNNPDAPGYFITWLLSKTSVHGHIMPGKWFDIGSVEMLERAKREFL